MSGAIPIGVFELALASGFVLVSGAISLGLKMGMIKSLAIASVRAYFQLTALGLALGWVFSISLPLLVLVFLFLMMLVATHTLILRQKRGYGGFFFVGLLSLAIPGTMVTFTVTGVIVGVDPWYEPSYVLPIGGMVIGNAMNAMAVSLDRLLSDIRESAPRIRALLALGATPREAVGRILGNAVRAGMIPTINSMSVAGIVFIPGMMTGQILSGTDPSVASGYQIVVLMMVACATALGSMLVVMTGYRRCFDVEDRLNEDF